MYSYLSALPGRRYCSYIAGVILAGLIGKGEFVFCNSCYLNCILALEFICEASANIASNFVPVVVFLSAFESSKLIVLLEVVLPRPCLGHF